MAPFAVCTGGNALREEVSGMRFRYLAVLVVVMGAMAVPASAAVWVNTPKHVARLLVTRFATPDGKRLIWAKCKGVWSSAHRQSPIGVEFHRLACAEVDRVARGFIVRVTVTGRLSLRATVVGCDDRHSRFICP
jgi:hypothetical protein